MAVRAELMDECADCHDRYFGKEVGHAPVAQRQCFQCHDAHRSRQEHLLTNTVLNLCVDCHDPPDELSAPSHKGDGVENCTRCHDPHFGSGKLLRAVDQSRKGNQGT